MSVVVEDEGVLAEIRAFNAELDRTLCEATPMETVPVEKVRQARREGEDVFPPPEYLGDRARDLSIPGRGGDLGLRVIAPEGREAVGAYVHIHGGGWVLGAVAHAERAPLGPAAAAAQHADHGALLRAVRAGDGRGGAPRSRCLAADLSDMPPALFSVGTLDPLYDDTLFMEARWRAAGGPTELVVHREAIHGYNMFPLRLAAASRAQQYAFLNAALSG